jgi:CRISPR-associated protein (TIGR02710 family)
MTTRPPCLSPDLAALTDAEVIAEDAALLEAARQRQPVDTARVAALQPELIWRQGLADDEAAQDLLILTVGSQADTPTNAALRWRAAQVVLLPSEATRSYAETVVEKLGLVRQNIVPVGDGEDPAAVYRTVMDVWQRAGRPERVVIDLSGGFKTMSSAAAVAAFALGKGRCTYLATAQEKVDGKTVWFSSRVAQLSNPFEVFGDLERERAQQLAQAGSYAAASALYHELSERVGGPRLVWRAELTGALEASAALRFAEAAAALRALHAHIVRDVKREPPLKHDPLAQTSALEWILARAAGLEAVAAVAGAAGKAEGKGKAGGKDKGADDPTRSLVALQADGFLHFIAELLLLAAQRTATAELDFAGLYAYRALEAIPQRRLARLGHDPGNIDWAAIFAGMGAHTEAEQDALAAKLLGKVARAADLRSEVDRAMSVALLHKLLEDPLYKGEGIDKLNNIAAGRNKSILAHGLQQVTEGAVQSMAATAERLFRRMCALEDRDADAIFKRHTAPDPATL